MYSTRFTEENPTHERDGSKASRLPFRYSWICSTTTTTAVVLAAIPQNPPVLLDSIHMFPLVGYCQTRMLAKHARRHVSRRAPAPGLPPQSRPHGWLLPLKFWKLRRAAVLRPVCGPRRPFPCRPRLPLNLLVSPVGRRSMAPYCVEVAVYLDGYVRSRAEWRAVPTWGTVQSVPPPAFQ